MSTTASHTPVRPIQRMMLVLAAAVIALAALLAVGVGTANAEATTGTGGVVLAVEGAGLLGPDPMPRNAEDNPARELAGYEDLETPFTWGAAWLLTFLGLAGVLAMGIVYWRSVERPGRNRAPVRR
jgi:peptidoglycan/LPS O-acetylase OafA/YrhL